MSEMQLQQSAAGDDLVKQFRKAVVSGGPLKGAQFFDVGWEDLKKAAKSYRSDARFNQFAKRRVSERALGRGVSTVPEPTTYQRWCLRLKSWRTWLFTFMRARLVLSIGLIVLLLVLLSRPLFYLVLAKGLALCIRLALRRSVGLVAIILDAILDEVAVNLETTLIAPPAAGPSVPLQTAGYELQQSQFFAQWLWHAFFGFLGAIIGHRLRAPPAVRTPTRLRVV